ncbi:MAG: hypothetical protein RH917_18605 [Lacipirellulaceae bacterium]
MASENIEEILKRFDTLSAEERENLILQLDRRQSDGHADSAQRTLFDALNERGLIGCIDDAPEDWSTNPKYMEGFGRNAQ